MKLPFKKRIKLADARSQGFHIIEDCLDERVQGMLETLFGVVQDNIQYVYKKVNRDLIYVDHWNLIGGDDYGNEQRGHTQNN